MMHAQMISGAEPLPLALIGQAISMLSRHELEALTERLIDRLDELQGDVDLEDSHDQEGIDEREEEPAEGMDCFHGIDQTKLVSVYSIASVDGLPYSL